MERSFTLASRACGEKKVCFVTLLGVLGDCGCCCCYWCGGGCGGLLSSFRCYYCYFVDDTSVSAICIKEKNVIFLRVLVYF